MSNFKIKTPRTKNIDVIVQTYNRKKGQGIEVFYNMKNGKLFIGDYYKSYSDGKTKKISAVSGNAHLSEISPEYLNEEINRIHQVEMQYRIDETKRHEEQVERFKMQRREHYLRKFGLKK